MSLYRVKTWIESFGEPLALTRASMKCMPFLAKLGLSLREATPETTVPNDTMNAVRSVATEVVGKPCPY